MRFSRAITRATVALSVALSVAMGASTGGAVAATGGIATAPTWTALQTYTSATTTGSVTTGSIAVPASIACASYGNCVAAGIMESTSSTGNGVMVESNGHWGSPISAPLPSDSTGGLPAFTSVACSSATACVAVGTYGTSAGSEPLAVPFTVSGMSVSFGIPQRVALPGNALTTGQGAFLDGVSCGSGGCAAVGTYETTGSVWTAIVATPGAGGAWTATPVPAPPAATNDSVLNAISCPSAGACEAVGTYGDAASHLQSWAVQVSAGVAGAAQPVTIAGAATASAVAPTASGLVNVEYGLVAVSCPSAGACTAAGTMPTGTSNIPTGLTLPITAAGPGQSSLLSSNGAPLYAYLLGISCSDAADCTAVGLEVSGLGAAAMTATEANGAWLTPVTLQSDVTTPVTSSIAVAEAVACTSPGVCVSGGIEEVQTSTSTILSSFFAYSAVPPTVGPGPLPAATVGQAYSATLQSSGGAGASSWAVTAGSLPAGLML
ncbi:MAG: hypothetical protein KGL16_10170, partial [Acidobacteriota bacterium]|nr:hypothetical protein [Acidobacteriota bacterium]